MKMKKRIVVGVPKEMMPQEGRVPIMPETAKTLHYLLLQHGTDLRFLVENGVGEKIGLEKARWACYDGMAEIVSEREKIFEKSDIILQVKQPREEDVSLYREGQGAFCFHHVPANEKNARLLFEKGVKLIPFEYHKPTMAAMSREAGLRVPEILRAHFPGPGDWKKESVLLMGARGRVCRTASESLLSSGMAAERIYGFDLEEGVFTNPDSGRSYETFRFSDGAKLFAALEKCRIAVLAALSNRKAPKILENRHLAALPNEAFIIQISIDEGGNIADGRFSRLTYGDNPVYKVEFAGKNVFLFNVPDIPGCIRPLQSSLSLDKANFTYYFKIFSSWPDVPREYLFQGF